MHTIQEQIKLWRNNLARLEFLRNYKEWGVWFTEDPLDLVFYKYDLNNGDQIIAMEYKRPNYRHSENDESYSTAYKLYIKEAGSPFMPNPLYEGYVASHLKDEKIRLQQKLKDLAA